MRRMVRNPLVKDWEIRINTLSRKIVAIALILTICGILVYRTWWLFLAAWITRTGSPDAAVYERATNYAPNNAEYHFVLGQIYNYSTQWLNLDRAREEYETAVRLNPERATYWLELSKYYEQAGNAERCRYAMKMALEKDPNYAQTHWAAANLYLRLGDLQAADVELQRSANLDESYLTQVLDLVWRFYGDPQKIMTAHVPNTKAANMTALAYFMAQKSEDGAAIAWKRLQAFETRPGERFNYIDYLVNNGKPRQAWEVFSAPGANSGIFFNPGFESEPVNGGFDWRFGSSDNAVARRDTTVAREGQASFLVSFTGKENIDYTQLWHWLPVEKGRHYTLKFWMKTDSISTNEGMFVEIDGQASEKQVGTTEWQEFAIPFVASSDLVTVRLRRVPTRKFDNFLKGKVWLDGFSLSEIP